MSTDQPLRVDLAGISLRNPLLLAAGTHGTLDEFGEVFDLSLIGGLVTKSITPQAREGNPAPPARVVPLRGGVGMLNAIGLANPGIEAFEAHDLPRASSLPCAVIASAAGFSIDDYVKACASLDDWGRAGSRSDSERSRASTPDPVPSIDAIELNVSCPNVHAGCEFAASPALLKELVTECRRHITRAALIVKLSPLVTDIVPIARAAIESGADALTVSNTIPAMAIDVRTRRPRLANITGGLSGPALHPVALRLVREVYTKIARDAHGRERPVPIIGAGGVLNWEDAAEFILAGATAVQMGTALMADPRSPVRVLRGLGRWVANQRAGSINELTGALVV